MGNGVSFPAAALHWHVPCYVGMGGLLCEGPCVRATALLARLEGQKTEITSCCLMSISKFHHKSKKKKKKEGRCQVPLTLLALQSLQCSFLGVFFLWIAKFTL